MRALESTSVYVDPDAERALSEREVERLEDAIARHDAAPLYIAVLPRSAADGDPPAALGELAFGIAEPGVYAAVIGDSFRAGASVGQLPRSSAGSLAAQSREAARGAGTAAMLEDFVRRVGAARSGGGGSSGSGGVPGGLLLLLLGIPAALFGWWRFRRRKQERAEFVRTSRP